MRCKAGQVVVTVWMLGLLAGCVMPEALPGASEELPSKPQAALAPLNGGERHVVQSGDALSQIARDYGVPLNALARSNYLSDIDRLPVGQVLCIPRLDWAWPPATGTVMEGTSYEVQEGDALLRIAWDHEVSLTALLLANRLTECSLIRPGEKLVIPAVGDTAADSLADNPPPSQEMMPLDFAYGIQGHARDEDQGRLVLAGIRDLGFTWLKHQVRWEEMEPQRGNRRWVGMDRLLAAAD